MRYYTQSRLEIVTGKVPEALTKGSPSPEFPFCSSFMGKGVVKLDVGSITQIIGSLGFPIFACIYLVWNQRQEEEMHRNEVDKLSDAIMNNTLVIQKLIDKLGGD